MGNCTLSGDQANGGPGSTGADGGNGFGGGVYNDSQSGLELHGTAVTDNAAVGGAAAAGPPVLAARNTDATSCRTSDSEWSCTIRLGPSLDGSLPVSLGTSSPSRCSSPSPTWRC